MHEERGEKENANLWRRDIRKDSGRDTGKRGNSSPGSLNETI